MHLATSRHTRAVDSWLCLVPSRQSSLRIRNEFIGKGNFCALSHHVSFPSCPANSRHDHAQPPGSKGLARAGALLLDTATSVLSLDNAELF